MQGSRYQGNESDKMSPTDVIFTKKNCIIIKLGFVGTCMYMLSLGELMAMKIKTE